MIRLIGGPSRCGKSTLARQAQKLSDGQSVSLDNLRRAFTTLASDSVREGLLVAPKVSEHTPSEWLDILRQRDRLQWKGTRAYLEAAALNQDDVIVEGCLWPDFIAELALEHRAVFLVDTSPTHVERVIATARSDEGHNNWMKQWSDDHLTAWAKYNIERSKLTKKLAEEHGYEVFDIADEGLEIIQSKALKYLFP